MNLIDLNALLLNLVIILGCASLFVFFLKKITILFKLKKHIRSEGLGNLLTGIWAGLFVFVAGVWAQNFSFSSLRSFNYLDLIASFISVLMQISILVVLMIMILYFGLRDLNKIGFSSKE